MDPFTGLGAAAAVTELLGVCIKSAKTAKDLYRAVKDAPDELQRLATKLDLVRCHIQQIQGFGDELSNTDMADLFPQSYREMLIVALRANSSSLEELKSLTRPRPGADLRARILWAALDKQKAKKIVEELSAAEETLNLGLNILSMSVAPVP